MIFFLFLYIHSVAVGGGKVIGTFCAVFGVLVIGLPIPIIGKSFNNFYAREKRREKLVLERAREEATSRAVTAQVNRAGNEPSRSLKFYNHRKGPLLKAATTTNTFTNPFYKTH